MSPAFALWCSLGLLVAGILVVIWICSRAGEVDRIEFDALSSSSTEGERP